MNKTKMILIAALIALVIALILFRGCGNLHPSSGKIDVKHVYDSIEQSYRFQVAACPTLLFKSKEKTVTRWLPGATVRDTIYIDGSTVYVYNDAPTDTAADS
jgi:hypothetical protein